MPAKTPTREHMPLYFFIALLTFFSACGILGSDDDKEPLEPGPRNYEWTVDSVYSAPSGWLSDIWGSSPDNVYAVSGGGLTRLWHYDGEKWSANEEQLAGSLLSIHGFAENDIWIGGDDGKIFRYDGNEWTLSFQYKEANMSIVTVEDIWGSFSSDIYATGLVLYPDQNPVGFLLHYDGSEWEELIQTDFEVQLQRVRKGKNGVFIRGINRDYGGGDPDTLKLYRYNKKELEEVVSLPQTSRTIRLWISKLRNYVYILNNNNLKVYKNKKFTTIKNFKNDIIVYNFFSRHKKDIFLNTSNGLSHFDGKNVKQLLNQIMYPTVMLFEEDIFFIARDHDQGTNLIYHGTLTETREERE